MICPVNFGVYPVFFFVSLKLPTRYASKRESCVLIITLSLMYYYSYYYYILPPFLHGRAVTTTNTTTYLTRMPSPYSVPICTYHDIVYCTLALHLLYFYHCNLLHTLKTSYIHIISLTLLAADTTDVLAAGAYYSFIRAAAQHAPAWVSDPIRGQIPKLAF